MKSLLGKLGVIFVIGIVIFGFGNIEILRAQGAWVLWTKHTESLSEEDIGRKEDIGGKKNLEIRKRVSFLCRLYAIQGKLCQRIAEIHRFSRDRTVKREDDANPN